MQERYRKEVAPALFKAFGMKNVMQVPSIEKIVVNIGIGEARIIQRLWNQPLPI
jgi:large subunit ribosomal protein L5